MPHDGAMSTIVTARGMSDRYGSTQVLRTVELDIPAGRTALLGPNGAGKTTLLHLVCGLRRPTGGSMTVMGVGESARRRRQQIAGLVGFLPQNFGYLPSYSVRDFVTYAAWLKQVPKADLVTRVGSALTDVGMLDRSGQKLRTLSGGMIRRAGIAAAIVHRPPLVVLDEPSAGLDPAQRRDLRLLLTRLAETSSVVVSTHLIEDVRGTFDNVVVLDDGTVRFTGSPAELESAQVRSTDAAGATDTNATGESIEAGYLAVLGGDRDPR